MHTVIYCIQNNKKFSVFVLKAAAFEKAEVLESFLLQHVMSGIFHIRQYQKSKLNSSVENSSP